MAAYPRGREQMYGNMPQPGMHAIHPEYEMSGHHHHNAQQPQPQQQQQQRPHQGVGYDFQADLELFTNAQLFDLDMGEVPETGSPASHDGEVWNMQANYMADGQMPSFNHYNGPAHPHFNSAYNGPSSSSSPAGTPSHNESIRVKNEDPKAQPAVPQTLEEASRYAAEEDKRRRNTAASARFRVKKKQREQALEKTAKDMTDRVTFLEQRVQTLEMENKLLKDLITEKQGATGADIEVVKKRAADEAERVARGELTETERRKEVKIEAADAKR